MPQQTFQDGELNSSVRSKINENATDAESRLTGIESVLLQYEPFNGNHEKGTLSVQDKYMAIANKATTEQIAPTTGASEPTASDPDSTLQFAGLVRQDHTLVVNDPVTFDEISLWVSGSTTSVSYTLVLVNVNTGVAQVAALPILSAGAWNTVRIPKTTVIEPTTFRIIFDVIDYGVANEITGGWNQGNNNEIPITGKWSTNATHTQIQIHEEDLDAVDHVTEMAGLQVGSVVNFTETGDTTRSVSYVVDAVPTPSVNKVVTLTVVKTSEGAKGVPRTGRVCNGVFSTSAATNTSYPTKVGGTPLVSWGTIQNRLFLNGVDQGVTSDSFGINIETIPLTLSDDWDIIAQIL